MNLLSIEVIQAAHQARLLQGMTGVPSVIALSPGRAECVCGDIARLASGAKIKELANKSWKIAFAAGAVCLAAKGLHHLAKEHREKKALNELATSSQLQLANTEEHSECTRPNHSHAVSLSVSL
jgi:hypothetical protein